MKLLVDNREPDELINILKSRIDNIELKNLELGDFQIIDDDNNINEPLIIIERKSLSDLLSSIKDGRYNEQSFRLSESLLENSNIYYLVEGDTNKFIKYKKEQEVKMLYSSMLSLSYYKQFHLIKCISIIDSCEFIIRFYEKFCKDRVKLRKSKIKMDKNSKIYTKFNNEQVVNEQVVNEQVVNEQVNREDISNNLKLEFIQNYSDIDSSKSKQYIDVIKTTKKSNITIDNIDIIMLSQIPNISTTTASELIKEYKSLKNLIYNLEKNVNILDNFNIRTNNSSRKLNKTGITNLKKYLLHIKN